MKANQLLLVPGGLPLLRSSHRPVRPRLLLKKLTCIAMMLSSADAAVERTETGAIGFADVPRDGRVVTIPLAVSEENSGQPGYLMQRAPDSLAAISELPASISDQYARKEFSAFEFAALADGTRYIVVLNENKEIKFLNRTEPGFWYARVYRIPPGGGKAELLKEGLQTPGNDVTVPVELELPGIGATKLKKVKTEVGYSLNTFPGNTPHVTAGRGAPLQLSGSRLMPEGKLTLSVTVPESMKVTQDTEVSLRFEPVSSGLPEHRTSGKLSDFLSLGSARFVVASMAPDFSEASLAIVAGSLKETMEQQLRLGSELPAFAHLDLPSRKTIMRRDLLAAAEDSPGIVFLFGEIAPVGGRTPYAPPPGAGMGALPLTPGEVAEQLGLELDPKPVVVFVTRQIGVDILYGELRNKTPNYYILTDFADPLRTTFRSAQGGPGHWYGPPYPGAREPSLRQLFNLPEGKLSIAAFDSAGKVIYVKAEAGGEFLLAIEEARKAMAEHQ